MLELGIGADLVRGISWIVRILFLILIGIALWYGRTLQRKAIYITLIIGVFFGPLLPGVYQTWKYKKRYEKAKALFDERCKSAGEKIYKTVEDVEGVLLLNVRPEYRLSDRSDPNWLGAGVPDESGGDGYIRSFLSWEHEPRAYDKEWKVRKAEKLPGERGKLNSSPTDGEGFSVLRGYRFVDVKIPEDRVYRYQFDKSSDNSLSRVPAPFAYARYAVAYKPLFDPADRAYWVAGMTVVITDEKNNELIAEKTWYSFEPGLGNRNQRTPWSFSVTCPVTPRGTAYAPTRFFVDQVLKPRQ